jgi:hypothetical protein
LKSSVRILAIALALAFLLLARTAFQDDTTASAAAIDLKDGEASFADLLDGTQESVYLGFNQSDRKTAEVYFYVKSDDLGTQGTASTTITLGGGNFTGGDFKVTLPVGDAVAGTVATSTITSALEAEYCTQDAATTTVALDGDVPDGSIGAVIPLPSGWRLASSTTQQVVDDCTRDRVAGSDSTFKAATTTDTSLEDMAEAVQATVYAAEAKRAQDANHEIYEYDDDSYTKVNKYLRYTHGDDGNMAGGDDRPLASVTATLVADDSEVLTFVTNKAGREFQDISRSLSNNDVLQVEATFDIVDMYPAEDDTLANAAAKAYGSGFGRAYVSSGSDSGLWVPISEVAKVVDNAAGASSPTSNLFQGVVTIVNDTSLETDDVIYVQDGDTLTLTVVSSDGKRSSNVIASATALIDNSAPTISDLSPADDSVINDDTLQISFNVNDEGSGLDFRAVDEKAVVTKVEAEEIGSDGKGTGDRCVLTEEADDIDNAGGNANRVGVLISPGGNNDFSSRCPQHVDTTMNSDNSDGVKFNLVITAQDLAGNLVEHTTQLTIDTDDPTVEGNPGAGQGWNEDDNESSSSQNSILVKFNESLDVDTVAVADFTVAGYTIDTAEVVGENEEDSDDNQHLNEYVLLTLTEDLAKNARPSVTVTGVSDVAGNAIETTTRTSDNKIKASINVVSFSALVAEKGEQAITFSSDEALRSTSGDNSTEASVNGTTLSVKVADDTLGGSATFKQSASAFKNSRAYGVMIQAVDVDGNTTRVGGVKVSDEDVKLGNDLVPGVSTSTVDVKLANWPPADTDFDGEFAGEVKAYVGKNVVAESVGDPDWDAGTVTLTAEAGVSAGLVEEGDTVTLKYSYVNSNQVIQVDVDEPEMTSTPADNAETDYTAGAIQFIWSEAGEYAGDSYKTVTLNEASHEGPDGESMDILDQLTTNDEKKWVLRPAEDLALGAHEFTLKATDAAGNDATVSTTITVIERKPVEVGLSPGWNLISFRGEPASLDANDIFSSDTVSVVSQYDGRRVSPWTVWTRGSDGSLSSSPAGRTTIDPGLGLYVLSTDGSALMVDIPGTSKDDPAQVPPSIELIPGWNMVAVIIIDRDEDSVDIDAYLPAEVWTRAFRLSSLTGALESLSPGTGDNPAEDDSTADDLMAGQALWVYAAKAGVIVPK